LEAEVTLKPIFPQFSRACGQFVRPTGFPRPFGALDWCPRCGQPDWAHQAGSGSRYARLSQLDPQRMSDMLEYLCEYAPGAFDVIDHEVQSAEDCRDQEAEALEEPFCVACGAPLAIFPADGLYYRHYQETPDGECRRFSVEHPTVIGWRQRTAI
jgi:hypothetical protein